VSYLLDTNVLSEWRKPEPDPGVLHWLDQADEDGLFVSVVTFAELRRGAERLVRGTRKTQLDHWITVELPTHFDGRILGIDQETADRWGRIFSLAESIGRPIGAMEAFLAATAEQHHLRLVTRNVRDFVSIGLAITNPWTS
jgi:predicted nucleic acid-binding protein